MLRVFDLSNSRSLRSLEIGIPQPCSGGMGFLRDLLSTITSPVFSDVVIILPDVIIRNPKFLKNTLFRAVRRMCEVKSFRLVFRLGKSPQAGEDNRGRLKEMIGAQAAKGRLGPLLHPPVIVSYTQPVRSVGSVESEHLFGWAMECPGLLRPPVELAVDFHVAMGFYHAELHQASTRAIAYPSGRKSQSFTGGV